MIDTVVAWQEHVTVGGVLFAVGFMVVMLAGSVLVAGALLVKVPPLYFQDFHARDVWNDRHPVLRGVGKIGKNLLGVVLLGLGVLLSLPGVPGPGLLTMLIGLVLVDLPGKRKLERSILGRPSVLRTVNRLRKRFGEPPLVLGERGGRARR